MAKAETKRISRAERRRQRDEARRRRILMWGGMAIAVLALVGFAGARLIAQPSIGQEVRSMGNQHIGPDQVGSIVYNSTPPTSGPHLVQLAGWGIHTEPIPNEMQVHNLEDGGVMVQYSCSDCDELVAQLEDVVQRYHERVILAPYPALDDLIALTAWGRIDKLDRFEEDRIVAFIDAYAGADHHVAAP